MKKKRIGKMKERKKEESKADDTEDF